MWLSAKTFILAGASVKRNVKWHKKENKTSQRKPRQAYGWESHGIPGPVQCRNEKRSIDGLRDEDKA